MCRGGEEHHGPSAVKSFSDRPRLFQCSVRAVGDLAALAGGNDMLMWTEESCGARIHLSEQLVRHCRNVLGAARTGDSMWRKGHEKHDVFQRRGGFSHRD